MSDDAPERGRLKTLGFYTPGGAANVLLSSDALKHSVDATIVHETIHRALSENTAYGHLQIALAIAEDSVRPDDRTMAAAFRRWAQRALEHGFLVHEGVATMFQLQQVTRERGLASAVSFRASLPGNYQQALLMTEQLVARLRLPCERITVAYELAEWAFNAPFPSLIPDLCDLSDATFESRLGQISPAVRFETLADRLTDAATVRSIHAEFARRSADPDLARRASAIGDPGRVTAWAVYQALHACVGPVFGDGDPAAVGNATVQAVELLKARAAGRGLRNLASMTLEKERDVHEGRERVHAVEFYPDEPKDVEYAIVPDTLDAARASQFLIGVAKGDTLYVHLFEPPARTGLARPTLPDEALVVACVYRGNPVALDPFHLVFPVKQHDLPAIVSDAAKAGQLVLTSAFEAIAAEPSTARANLLDTLEALVPIIFYFRSDGMSHAKRFCEWVFGLGGRIDLIAVRAEQHGMNALFAVPDVMRWIPMLPVGPMAAKTFVDWLASSGHPASFLGDEADARVGLGRMTIALDHYRRLGY